MLNKTICQHLGNSPVSVFVPRSKICQNENQKTSMVQQKTCSYLFGLKNTSRFLYTEICFMWLELIKHISNGGLMVIYNGRKQQITLYKHKYIETCDDPQRIQPMPPHGECHHAPWTNRSKRPRVVYRVRWEEIWQTRLTRIDVRMCVFSYS